MIEQSKRGEGARAPLVYKSMPPARIHRALQMTFRISCISTAGSKVAAAWLGLGLQARQATEPLPPQASQDVAPLAPHCWQKPNTFAIPKLFGP